MALVLLKQSPPLLASEHIGPNFCCQEFAGERRVLGGFDKTYRVGIGNLE